MGHKSKTSWGTVAEWYNGIVNNPDSYQSKVILPNIMRIVPTKANDALIDIACGQGLFSYAFAEQGVKVVGVDIAKELIDIAREHGKTFEHSTKPVFQVGSAHDLSGVEDRRFDHALTVLALQNIEDINGCIASVSRVLRSGGVWTIVLNHPAFRQPKRSSWEWLKDVLYRRIDAYMSEYSISIDMHPGSESKQSTISFHRPLQLYMKLFTKHGFVMTRLEEWISHKVSEQGPRSVEEDRMRKEIPLFLAIQLRLDN